MRKHWSVIHAILFYAIWYYSVISACTSNKDLNAIIAQAIFVGLCLIITDIPKLRFFIYIFVIGIVGSILDSIPIYFGFLSLPHSELYISIYPIWLVGMWLSFATAIPLSLSWMKNKIFIQIMFGAIGGPLSLFAATKMGAAIFLKPLPLTFVVYAVEWAAVVPASFLIANKFIKTR